MMPAKYQICCGQVFIGSPVWVSFDFFAALAVYKATTQVSPNKYTNKASQ